jgi:hypothetical protein
MTALRVVIGLLALGAGVAGLMIPQPEVFAFSSSAALLILVIGCGAVAADALPLRPLPLVCSIATVPLAVVLFRPFSVAPVAFAILALQGLAWWAARRHRASGPEPTAPLRA